jgi:hypothetical protein
MSKLPLIPAITVCLLLFVSIIPGCSSKKPVPLTPVQTPALTGPEILSKSSQAMQALNSYHFALDQTGGGTPLGIGLEMNKAVGDIVRPDKMQTTVSGTFSGMALTVQIISAGGTTLMTNPLNGNWEQLPAQFNVLGLFDPNTGIAAIMNGVSNVTRLADVNSSGVLSYHLSGNINSEALNAITGSSIKGTSIGVEVWIGENDLLVRTIQLTGQITETEVPGIVRTLTLSNFNAPVSIELPK